LITKSSFVGCSTARSAGFSPQKILVDVNSRALGQRIKVWRIRHKTASLRKSTIGIDRWQLQTLRSRAASSLGRGMVAKRAVPEIFEHGSAPICVAAGLMKGTPLQF
jgi:hypothetical protein